MSSENCEDDGTDSEIEIGKDVQEESELSFSENSIFSKAVTSVNSTVPSDIVEFMHSFSFDCKKNHSFCVMEDSVIVFASGNLLHFFNTTTLTITTRRSALGGGFGAIKKNPVMSYLTVAENGKNPPIFIYSYPDMSTISILRKGTTRSYACLDYSPNGTMLVSQGGDPDYTLTVWNWKESTVILNVKSYHNTVFNLAFSPSVFGQITTCGIGHIKFWKMTQTFTGLKLQGETGRFGKTEISDICGVFPMPDEKVLSGSEWGNILVWEHGLITLEVCRKGRRRCHSGNITKIFAREGEIVTIGTDGFIRIWFWETVELADPPENNRFVEIEPIYEYFIGIGTYTSELLSMERIEGQKFFLQDGNGGIWQYDISPDRKDEPPKQLLFCHSGPIFKIQSSPTSDHVATFGRDGRLFMYNYETKKLIFNYQFISQGNDMIWLPVSIDPTGIVLVLAFDDGVIRVVTVDLSENPDNDEPIQLIQVLKSHSEPIRKISINERETILVSGGDDNLIFIHQISKELPYIKLIPIGLVETPSAVSCINWKPDMIATILVGCSKGEVIEADLPEETRTYTDISYRLNHIEPNAIKFISVKGQIRRNILLEAIELRKAKKRKKKLKKLEKMREANPGTEINEEAFLEDSDPGDDLGPVVVPKTPNKVLWAQYTSNGTIWLSMGGYDAGYIYEYDFDQEGPVTVTPIPMAEDCEINCYTYFDSYLIFGMGDGSLRINSVKEDFTDLSDYWILNMHEGHIFDINFSYNKKLLFTGGADGNLFSYKWNQNLASVIPPTRTTPVKLEKSVEDITDICFLSLEEEKQKADHDRRMEVALNRRKEVLKVIANCKEQFEAMLKRNNALAASQRIPYQQLELDIRIKENLKKRFDEEMDLVKRKKEFDVEKARLGGEKLFEYFLAPLDGMPIKVLGIKCKTVVESFRIHKLNDDYFASMKDLEERIVKDSERKRMIVSAEEKEEIIEDAQGEQLESFLQGLTESDIELRLESKCRRLLRKYRERKAKEAIRKKEWNELNALKPDPNVNDPDDDLKIEEAEKTIGDFKLKTDPVFDSTDEMRDTTLKKFKELLEVRKEIYDIRKAYNDKVFDLRREKIEVLNYVETKKQVLADIHSELEPEKRKQANVSVIIDQKLEYPERDIDLDMYLCPEKREGDLIFNPSLGESGDRFSNAQKEIIGLTSKQDRLTLTSAERDLIQNRLDAQLYEQDRIIHQIEQRVNAYDLKVQDLFEERLQVEVDAKFLEQYLITLNQELWILKDFEQLEERLVDKMEQLIFEQNRIYMQLIKERNDIDTFKGNIVEIEEQQSDIESRFIEKCQNDPYWKYFRKIFYKKYRPPRIHKERNYDEDAEYETETESSLSDLYQSSGDDEEENDEVEGKTTCIDVKTLNENSCPENCDIELFRLAHDSRVQYQYLQGGLVENDAKIIQANQEIKTLTDRQLQLREELKKIKQDIVVFRRDKQKKLNSIETVVILKMDQIQFFKDANELGNIEDTLLFSNSNVTKLYARIGELALETLEVKRKHRVNVVHLSRMKADIKFMEQRILELKEEINSAMMKKFGRIIDLDELEEAILRRFVFEMSTNKEDVKQEYAIKINEIKNLLAKKEEEYTKVIQEGTEKLNILTVLQEEKNYLNHILVQQRKQEEKSKTRDHQDYKKDVLKLRAISKHQKEQIEILQNEINGFNFKCNKPSSGSHNAEKNNFQTNPGQPLTTFHQRIFEDSVYTNIVESRGDSSKASTPNMELFKEISRVIKMFLMKSVPDKFETRPVQTLVCTLSRYLTNIAANFPPTHTAKLLPDIIENFQQFFPQDILKQVKKRDIAELIENIVGHFPDEYDMEPMDVVKEIILNSYAEMTKNDPNYSQKFFTEVIKQMIVTLRLHDVGDDEILKQVAKDIINKKCNICSLNIKDMVNEIRNYAVENYLDDFDQDFIKSIIDKIIYLVQQK
uniref:CSON006942 protein n=1 Tax=Culicoides sonorensis TaxID=179676 RepID=A0A336MUJ4_CULSO